MKLWSFNQSRFILGLSLVPALLFGKVDSLKRNRYTPIEEGKGRLFGKVNNSFRSETSRAVGEPPDRSPAAPAVVYIFSKKFKLKVDNEGNSQTGVIDFRDAVPTLVLPTDSEGQFLADLSPGVYSVFIDLGNGLEPLEGWNPEPALTKEFVSFEVSANLSADANQIISRNGRHDFQMIIFSSLEK